MIWNVLVYYFLCYVEVYAVFPMNRILSKICNIIVSIYLGLCQLLVYSLLE